MIPYLRAALDVDGSDISEDILSKAGFMEVAVLDGYTDGLATSASTTLTFVATA